MKEGWEYSTIGDLCDKMNGLWKGKIGPFVNVGVIRNANFTKSFTLSFDNIEYLDVEAKQFKTRKLQKGDLIVEKSGGSEKQPVGRTVLFDKEEGEYSFSNFTSVLRIKDRTIISPEFLYKYILFVYLRGDTRKMQKATTGIHNIEFDKFLSISVPKITLSEQQSIVDYLDSAFAKIDAMKANAEKSLNEAKALFQASLKEMLEPKEGWEKKKIKDIGSVIGGTTPNTNVAEFWDGTLCWISPAELDGSHYLYDSKKKITEAAVKAKSLKLLPEGTVILSSRAPIGKVVINKVPTYCNQGFKCVVCGKEIYNEFLYWWFWGNTQYLNSLGTGATFKEISKKVVEEILIPVPSLSEQQSIIATLDSLKSKVDRLQANYAKISLECDALKQAILRQIFE